MPIVVEPGLGVIRYGLSRRRASTAARASSSSRFFSNARSSVAPHWAQTTGSFGRGLAVAAVNFVLPHDGHLSVTLICVMNAVGYGCPTTLTGELALVSELLPSCPAR